MSSCRRSQSRSRRRGFAALGAVSLLAGLALACSGDAADESVPPPPLPPPPPAANPPPPLDDGIGEAPHASGEVSEGEPAPTPPSASEGPGAPPPLDPGAAAGPPAAPPPEPAPEPAPPPEPAPVPPPPVAQGSAPSCLPPEGSATALRLTEVVSGLTEPTFVTAAPGDTSRLYVLERAGTIRVVRDGQLLPEPFLDLTGRVATEDEEGLVGLAFHPDFQNNGRFFVEYALLDPARDEDADEQVVLSEFARSESEPDRADAGSERTLLVVEQPATIHLGGMLAFGPQDGMLYVSRGNGGTNNGPQDTERLYGKMLRIDVDSTSDDLPYGLPEGNMGGDGVLPEIWSMGFRNPWRFSFDACTGDIYVGDVGEGTFEEIDVEPANTPGRNYGWRVLEGPMCVDATTACDASSFTPPTVTYGRDYGCAVTGGYVYRGSRIPGLRGTYLYADYCSGNFSSFRFEGGQAVGALDITADLNPDGVRRISAFGQDNGGELYVVSLLGSVYRIDPE